MTETFFIERLDEIELRAHEAHAFDEIKRHRHAGCALGTTRRETFVTLPPTEDLPNAVPSTLRVDAQAFAETPELVRPDDVGASLFLPLLSAANEAGASLQLTLRHLVRRTRVVSRHLAPSTRETVILELRVSRERDGKRATIQREAASSSAPELISRIHALLGLVEEMAAFASHRLDARALERAESTCIVLPPGADAGVLFHELCGHPLEGDVVAQSASYLAARMGTQVGPEFLTLVDDPTAGGGTVSYAFDDEGTPARKAQLIRHGKVDEPLLDLAFAERLGREANGHGRRGSYRAPALPRMAHTAVVGHEGDFEQILADVKDGVLIRALTPRHVHLRSGDFSFFVDEAQRIRDGRLAEFLQPTLLRGNGLDTLGNIDAVGKDAAPFFGLKACGKAETPVAVSFGNPTLRIRRMELTPR